MQLSTAIRQRIIELNTENNINLNTLSTNAGLTPSTLGSFMSGDSNDPQISTLLHICEGYKISLRDFFDSPFFDDVISEKDNELIK